MRAYAWIFSSAVVLACGGSAFTTTDGGNSGSGGSGDTAGDGATAGVLGRGGRGSGGSLIGGGGKISGAGNGNMSGSATTAGTGSMGGSGSMGGTGSTAGDVGIAGDLVTAGSVSMAGSQGTAGSSPDPIDKVCPVNQPPLGGGCANGLSCTYGTDIRTGCRTLATCNDGVWGLYEPLCEDLHGCPNILVGKACDANTAKPCMLDAYVYCICTGCGNAGPCSDNTVWACAGSAGGNGCPKGAPNQGQMCTGNASCDYGSCSTENPQHASCSGTTWKWDIATCPN